MKRAVIVQGMGFGDEGKAATVDFLARELSADWVVRYCGGSQAGHNVVLPDGRRHTFSQFGAGTFAGASTYLGEHMIIHLPAMHNEARHLHGLTGVDPFNKLLIHPQALVSTIYHRQLNRLRELSRGVARHGSCGHGIGETRSYWLAHRDDALFAGDLQYRDVVCEKMELARLRLSLEARKLIANVPADERWRIECFETPSRPACIELMELAEPLAIDAAMPDYTTAIFEGAQGVLLDEDRGFHPFTTWSTVTLEHALEMIAESQADEVCTLGLTRAYATRHGAGPLPTASPDLSGRLLDPGNPANAWQGTIRYGWLDLVLLRYAVEAAGGKFDGLVINNLDELPDDAQVCTDYRCADGTERDCLPVSLQASRAAQTDLTAIVESARPIYRQALIDAICALAAEVVAPIAISGQGPTWKDRTMHRLPFHSAEESLAIVCCGSS